MQLSSKKCSLNENINNIKKLLGTQNESVIRNFIIGRGNYLEAAIIYMDGLAKKDMIDRDILNPLMLHVNENFISMENIEEYICKKYIAVSNTYVETDINKVVDNIKRGKTILLVQDSCKFIIIDTTGGVYRAITEPANEIALRGPREGFVENLEINISMLRRKIKDKNLATEKFVLGRRSQTDLVIMYIDDIVDKEFLQKIKAKINTIDIDSVTENGILEQCMEEHPYSIFPQVIGTERPEVVESKLMEGKIAFLLSGTPYVTTYPTTFIEFFQTPEDYLGRVIQTFLTRMLRIIAVFIVISFPAIYITLIKFNQELIPIDYIKSLIQARKGISLSPFMSLLGMQINLELMREGALRMPTKIGQSLSIVGGIIIGDAALKAKVVSSSTLLIAGISVVASFAISYYQMSVSIRLLVYPMLILSNWLGILGIVIGWFFILAYLCSMENFGVPYFSFPKSDMKDILIRAPIWKMNKRPEAIPHNDPVRQSNFRGEKNK
ncbi:MAG TPA: spore germination protein [Clostridium sp.]